MDENSIRREIRVLHFGDVLLGSPFLSPAPEKSAVRRGTQMDAFKRLLNYIREQEIGLAIISGNLFAEEDLSDETASFLIRAFRSLSSCRFVIVPGTADPYTEDGFYASGRLPSNVTVVKGSDWERLSFPELGLAVYAAPASETPLPLPETEAEEGVLSLVATCRPTLPSDEERIASGAAYVALSGNPDCRLRECGGFFCSFSGTLESRGYEDEEPGGANLLMITEEAGVRRVHCKRCQFGTTRCLSREIDVSEMQSDTDLIKAVTRLIRENNLGSTAILRVVLNGSAQPGFRVPRRFDSGAFGLLAFSILNLTTPHGDEALKKDMSAKGELYRLLRPKIENGSDAERMAAARALTIGLTALEGKDIDNL